MGVIYKSGEELAQLIRDGDISSVDIVKAHLSRIEKINDELNAVVILNEEEALETAKERDSEAENGDIRGPLHGVPMTIKEQIWLKGNKSTINIDQLKDWIAPEDAVIVRRLKEAGAVILGKTNVPRQLFDYQVWGDIYPDGKNPYDTDRSPGGSSGGAAAALASGMVPCELGGDFGGSIRIPANFCGVYGLRPTEYTIPGHGHIPKPEGAKGHVFKMGTGGPMARTLGDLEILWKIIRGPDPSDRITPPVDWPDAQDMSLSDFDIAWIDRWPEFTPSPATQDIISNFIEQIKGKVASVEEASTLQNGLHLRSLRVWFRLMGKLLAQDLPWYARYLMRWDLSSKLGSGLKRFKQDYNKGFSMSFPHYSEVMGERSEVTSEFEQFFEDYDLLICPMSYGPAYERQKMGKPISTEEGTVEYLNYCFPYVACFNASGHPSLNLPLGLNRRGLPVGIQIVGAYWSEPLIIQFAKLVSEFTPGFVEPELET